MSSDKKNRFRRKNLAAWFVLLAVMASVAGLSARAMACPFCSAQGQTLSEELASADVVVLAELIKPTGQPKIDESDIGAIGVPDPDSDEAKFKIVDVLKGKKLIDGVEEIETIFYGEGEGGSVFMITGLGSDKPEWSTPIPLSAAGRAYLAKLPGLPKDEVERLNFFQGYLENPDPMLAQDAYDEFARASYETVQGLKGHMDREQLVEWIRDIKVPPSRRRLYFTMLGVCGGEADIQMLEEMIRSDDEKTKSALDAMVACYLTLSGEKGLPLVEELFLKNQDARYVDTYSTIMAIRFHARQGDVIGRERLIVSMRYLLDHPDLVDQIIPDLARWKDWSVMDQLVEMFKSDDKKFKWVRVPIVNYLMAASREKDETADKAKAALDELTELDPKTVARAKSFFAFGSYGSGRTSEGRESGDSKKKATSAESAKDEGSKEPATSDKPTDEKKTDEKTDKKKTNEKKEDDKSNDAKTTDAKETGEKGSNAKAASEVKANSDSKSSQKETPAPEAPNAEEQNPDTPEAKTSPAEESSEEKTKPASDETSPGEAGKEPTVAVSGESGAGDRTAEQPEEALDAPSHAVILGTTIVVGLVLLAALWFILTGAGQGRTQ